MLGFYWYYQRIQQIGPTTSGVCINFVPVSAIILASLILGEPVTRERITGATLVLTGVFLTNITWKSGPGTAGTDAGVKQMK